MSSFPHDIRQGSSTMDGVSGQPYEQSRPAFVNTNTGAHAAYEHANTSPESANEVTAELPPVTVPVREHANAGAAVSANSTNGHANGTNEHTNSGREQHEQALSRAERLAVLFGLKADPRLEARGMVAHRVRGLTWCYERREQREARAARVRREHELRMKARALAARVESMKTALAPLLHVEPHEVDLRVPVTFDEITDADPDEDETGDAADRARRARTVTLALPDHFNHGAKEQVSGLVHDRLGGGQWVSTWHMDHHPHYVEFRRKVAKPKPPTRVEWALSDHMYKIYVGQTGTRPVYVETETETPHWGVSAGTGGGKTTTLLLPAVHWRGHGGLLDIIDLKQESYESSIQGESGYRVHTDVIAAVRAMAEFLVSSKAVTIAKEQGYPTEQIPPRVLIIDEFGSFVSAVENWWKYGLGQKGKPPVFAWFHMILMQGRTKNHRVVVGTHDFSSATFGGTSVRDLIGTKILVGHISGPKWVTAFGYEQKKLNIAAQTPGRSAIGIAGVGVEEMQLAHITDEEARAVSSDFTPAPEWFDNNEMAPWISEEAIEMADREASVRPFLPGGEYVTYDDPDPTSYASTGAPVQVEQASTGLHVVRDAAAEQGAQLVGLRESLDKGLLPQLLREAQYRNPDDSRDELTRKALGVLRKGSKTDDAFPAPQRNRGSEKLYLVRELWTWEENRPTRMNFDDSDQSDTDSGPQASGE